MATFVTISAGLVVFYTKFHLMSCMLIRVSDPTQLDSNNPEVRSGRTSKPISPKTIHVQFAQSTIQLAGVAPSTSSSRDKAEFTILLILLLKWKDVKTWRPRWSRIFMPPRKCDEAGWCLMSDPFVLRSLVMMLSDSSAGRFHEWHFRLISTTCSCLIAFACKSKHSVTLFKVDLNIQSFVTGLLDDPEAQADQRLVWVSRLIVQLYTLPWPGMPNTRRRGQGVKL